MSKFKFQPKKNVDKPSGFTNGQRAVSAAKLVRQHAKIKPLDDLDVYNAYDLLSDIFHLCDKRGWNVDEVIDHAKSNWMDER
jgi:hypothetical protein